MSLYEVHYTWTISYYPSSTPFSESGGGGLDTIKVNGTGSEEAREIAYQKIDSYLQSSISGLSEDEDPSYDFSIEEIKLLEDVCADEYQFDYRKAKPNRFAPTHNSRVVILDEDVANVFNTPNSVNEALRSLIKPEPQDT